MPVKDIFKTKYGVKVVHIHVPVYNEGLLFTVCPPEQCKALVKAYFNHDIDIFEGEYGCTFNIKDPHDNNKLVRILWITDLRTRSYTSLAFLVHEVSHIAHLILNNKNIPCNIDTLEVVAYLEQYLFTEIIKGYNTIK